MQAKATTTSSNEQDNDYYIKCTKQVQISQRTAYVHPSLVHQPRCSHIRPKLQTQVQSLLEQDLHQGSVLNMVGGTMMPPMLVMSRSVIKKKS